MMKKYFFDLWFSPAIQFFHPSNDSGAFAALLGPPGAAPKKTVRDNAIFSTSTIWGWIPHQLRDWAHMMRWLKEAFSATLFFKKFTNTLPLLDPLTYRTARRVFYDLLTSAEAYFFTKSC